MTMKGLGRLFDVATVQAVHDLAAAASTGNPVSLKNAGGITFLVSLDAAASGTDDVVITIREAKDGAGASEQDLDVVTEYYRRAETTLDNDETWTKVTQTAGDITIAGATYATQEVLLSVYVDASDLSDDYTHITVDIADIGAVARSGEVIGILHDLKVMRAPENLAATQ